MKNSRLIRDYDFTTVSIDIRDSNGVIVHTITRSDSH